MIDSRGVTTISISLTKCRESLTERLFHVNIVGVWMDISQVIVRVLLLAFLKYWRNSNKNGSTKNQVIISSWTNKRSLVQWEEKTIKSAVSKSIDVILGLKKEIQQHKKLPLGIWCNHHPLRARGILTFGPIDGSFLSFLIIMSTYHQGYQLRIHLSPGESFVIVRLLRAAWKMRRKSSILDTTYR